MLDVVRWNEVSIHFHLNAYAEVRSQSLGKMLERFTSDRMHDLQVAIERTPDSVAPWALVHVILGQLPRLNDFDIRRPARAVQIQSELLTVYAFSFECSGNTSLFVGVAAFPWEAVDLLRCQVFVLLKEDDGTHFVTLDAFNRRSAGSLLERSFRVEQLYGVPLDGE